MSTDDGGLSRFEHDEMRDLVLAGTQRIRPAGTGLGHFVGAGAALLLIGVLAGSLLTWTFREPISPGIVRGTPPTRTPSMEASLTLRGDGIGPFTFGAKQVDVAAVLHDRLGYPDSPSEQGILCSRAGSPWAQGVVYGALWVYYTAKDQSQWSPRYLVAWGFDLDEKLPAALTMQDDVPLNLTFNQLKAKYPAGKLENLNWGPRIFTLPNKLRFIDNPADARPALVIAGQGAPCP